MMKAKPRTMKRLGHLAAAVFFFSAVAVADLAAVKTAVKPLIDGVIEESWRTGARFAPFKQIEPDILADATVRTEAYLLYDDSYLYVAMKLYQDRKTVHASRGRKDADLIKEGDFVTVAIDPLGNGNTAYFFTVNAENAVRDGTFDEYGTENVQWDATFSSAATIGDDAWSVELQIPLSSLSFQERKTQEWGIRLFRHFTGNQELEASSLADVHGPYRLTNFERLTGLEGLIRHNDVVVTPYVYSQSETDFLGRSDISRGKAGGEIRYMPGSAMTLVATVNPDYAQIETDKEIINVSDLPTEYPEKRPFFTESSDFYTNAAVNTRNIVDIKAGVKLRQVGDLAKYDVTGVVDGDDHDWLFGHLILGDNISYLTELTGGLKHQAGRDDYNVTTHLQKWLFDKRLSLSNWVGTINEPGKGKNEWETVNGIRWLSRTFNAGWWSHYKTELYNPNIVGWNYLSNEFHSILWTKYSVISGGGFLRTASLNVQYDSYALTSPGGHSYGTLTLTQEDILHLGEGLGNWSLCFVYMPATNQKFRFRQYDQATTDQVFEDAFSPFVLIDDRAASIAAEIRSDNTKGTGFTLAYNNNRVRQSKADNLTAEVYWKIGSDAMVRYSLNAIDIGGSPYQTAYRRTIHRFQAEYNITERLNIRVILQPDHARLPGNQEYVNNILSSNMTLSWEYLPGSYVYFVYNRYRNAGEVDTQPRALVRNNQSFVLKINKSIFL